MPQRPDPAKVSYDEEIKILPRSRARAMTQASFREQLLALLNAFLADGGCPWWMARELSQCGMQVIDNLRCDLVDTQNQEPPF
jgi:hypothetical protein